MPTSYRRLYKSDPEYQHILLQARGLQARIFHYDQKLVIPLKNPMVYLSSLTSELPIIIDTGALCSLTPTPSNFDGPLSKSDIKGLSQVNGEAAVFGTGTVTWNVEDTAGVRCSISTKAYYVPSSSVHLFSPQVYIGDNDKAQLLLNQDGTFLTLRCGLMLKFPVNRNSNLPFILTESSLSNQNKANKDLRTSYLATFHLGDEALQPFARHSVLNRDNYNLHPNQKKILTWHCWFIHADMQRVQMLLSKPHTPKGSSDRGDLPLRFVVPKSQGASSCAPPKCKACQYSKQHRMTPTNPKHASSIYEEGALSQENLNSGDKVSCAQYMCSTLGRLAHTHGKEGKAHKLVGGTVFVDHSSNFVFHHHQVNLTAMSSVHSKHACKAYFDCCGVKITQFASDNHTFCSKD